MSYGEVFIAEIRPVTAASGIEVSTNLQKWFPLSQLHSFHIPF